MKLAALVAVATGKSATFLDWLHHAENSGKLYYIKLTSFYQFRSISLTEVPFYNNFMV